MSHLPEADRFSIQARVSSVVSRCRSNSQRWFRPLHLSQGNTAVTACRSIRHLHSFLLFFATTQKGPRAQELMSHPCESRDGGDAYIVSSYSASAELWQLLFARLENMPCCRKPILCECRSRRVTAIFDLHLNEQFVRKRNGSQL